MNNSKDDDIILSGEPLDISFTGLHADDTISIDTIDLTGINMSGSITQNSLNYNYGNVTISNGSGPIGAQGSNGTYYYTNNTSAYNFTQPNSTLNVKGDAEFEGEIKWKGRSLGKMLEDIEKRLAILVPDPEKLEHFEALRKAYEHYKTLEALCQLPDKEQDDQ